jgi:S1-C subfamily serine protease
MIWILALLVQAPWADLVPTVQKSVPRVEIAKASGQGVCSAVVVEIDKDGFAIAVSAAHCYERQPTERMDVTANGRNAVVVHTNNILDLAIIRFRAREELPITLAPKSPQTGERVAAVGYGFGIEELAFQYGHVSQRTNRETKSIWLDLVALFGDSGGGIVDAEGRLVGITSRIYSGGMMGQMAHITAAVPIEQVADFLDDFRALREKAERERR